MLGLGANIVHPLNESFKESVVSDNLVLRHNYKLNPVQPLSDGAASFDGTSDYIVSGSNSGISGNSARTISCWVNLTAYNDADPIVCLDEQGSDTMFAIVVGVAGGGNWAIRVGSGSDLSSSSSSTSDHGSWVFLTATHDGTTTKLYRNGVEIASGARTLTTTDGLVYIGTDTSRYTNARVANVGLWDAALTQAQIKSIMWKKYSSLTSSEKTNLVSWWNLDSVIDSADLGDGDIVVYDNHHDGGDTLGSELITDGDFSLTGTQAASTSGTYWITGAGVTIASGVATSDGSGSVYGIILSLDVGLAFPYFAKNVAKVKFDVTNYVSGNMRVTPGNSQVTPTVDAYGSYEFIVNINTGTNFLNIMHHSTVFNGSISNISVKLFNGNEGILS